MPPLTTTVVISAQKGKAKTIIVYALHTRRKEKKAVSVSIITTALGAARKFQQETPVWKCFVLIRTCLFPSKDALWH